MADFNAAGEGLLHLVVEAEGKAHGQDVKRSQRVVEQMPLLALARGLGLLAIGGDVFGEGG
ncbi:MAG: hypothetical protein EBS05_25640, partial [Proteobacteria bacterium]|nr:hypothetical protein [Pseudomonadota bacterium]